MIRYICLFIMSIATLPQIAAAQDAEGGLSLIFGYLALLLLGLGVPTLISLMIRYVTGSIVKTYIGSYVVILTVYLLAGQVIEGVPGGSIRSIALNLLPLSMFGTFMTQWIYYLRLPKRKI